MIAFRAPRFESPLGSSVTSLATGFCTMWFWPVHFCNKFGHCPPYTAILGPLTRIFSRGIFGKKAVRILKIPREKPARILKGEKKVCPVVEIHGSRGAPLNDYIPDLQKRLIFSIVFVWWQLWRNKCHQRVYLVDGDDFYFWVFQNCVSSHRYLIKLTDIWPKLTERNVFCMIKLTDIWPKLTDFPM